MDIVGTVQGVGTDQGLGIDLSPIYMFFSGICI